MRTLVCCHCGQEVPRSKKLKHLHQRYCGAKACQNARKQAFERKKYQTDSSFRAKKLKQAKQTRQSHADRGDPQACSRYQADYRASHPDYVEENRKKQRLRNARKKQKKADEAKIVNPDTLILQQSDNDTVYAMIAVDYKKIVNPDTFMLQFPDIETFISTRPMFVRLL